MFIACEPCFNCGIAQNSAIYPTPWTEEIKLPGHLAHIPNNSFYLDDSGHLFLGKENGLSILNESSTAHIDMDGPVYVTGNGSDTLFYAGLNDLGMLRKENSGQFNARSYRDRLSKSDRKFIPTQLIYAEHSIFMNSDKGVYQFKNGRFEIFPNQGVESRLYIIEEDLYLRVSGKGLLKWSGDGFHEKPGETRADDPTGVPDLVESRPGTVFLDFLSRDEMLVVSPDHGLQVINRHGVTISAMGNRDGFPDRDILQAITTNGDALWILGVYTLHKINHPSSLKTLHTDREMVGRIFTSAVTGQGIVLGTNHGLFMAGPIEGVDEAWKIYAVSQDAPGIYHLMDKAGNVVFSAGSNHLLAITGVHSKVLESGRFTGLKAIRTDLVIASGEEGISRYEFKDSSWSATMIDPSLLCAHTFTGHLDNLFFICNNGAFRLSDNFEEVIPIPFHPKGLLLKLISIDKTLYLVTANQLYRYGEDQETFLPVKQDDGEMILAESGLKKYISSFPVLQNLGEIIDINIRDSILYLTGMHKVSLFDLSLPDTYGSEIPVRIEHKGAFRKANSAAFHIAGLKFQNNPEPQFRYRLTPEHDQWTPWSSDREIRLERLRRGDYSLFVEARDLYGRSSEPVEFEFVIRPPFFRRWFAYAIYLLTSLVILFLIQKLRLLGMQRTESRISKRMESKLDDLRAEKEKSDRLVAEILPNRTAAQIKSQGKAKWDKYERATVLFSDIQGFTKIAEEMNPEKLIDELDQFFFHFDSVVEKYNIEKIKTIGDAYMAAGGIPEKNSTNPVEMVLAALEMQAYMQHLKSSKVDIWDLRIGIHTGPVIAGVVGHKKKSYDIWGDTVNTASRMESSGTPGKVNISGITYGMVKEYFICEYRGKLPVKYKGNIDMYYVTGLRPELSVDLKGIPNKRFFIKLQLLRLGDLEEKVFGTLLSELPSTLHFYCIEYARKVYNQSFLLCRAEEIEQDERLLVRTAALLLYTGLAQTFFNYENRSAVIAREILPGFKYSDSQVDRICNLILATKQPFQPNNQLEKILIDAKMEYLGRPDYTSRLKDQYQEFKEAGSNINGPQFKKQQLEFLYEFEFFTVAARRLREVPGKDQMTNLEQERWI
ncbi:MAG: adenylate/guanylate cyclase domain-containing protein [Bacteroidota bacterium]